MSIYAGIDPALDGKDGSTFSVPLYKKDFGGAIIVQDPTRVATVSLDDVFNKVSIAKRWIRVRLESKEITQETYNKLLKLLDSPDKENQNLGVQLILAKNGKEK